MGTKKGYVLRSTIVIPTYNERANIEPLVKRINSLSIPDLDILFVDDASPDGTINAIVDMMTINRNIHILPRTGKRGLGSAYIDGFKMALDTLSPDVIIQLDADLQHPPETIPKLLEAMATGADVVVASRKIKGGGSVGWSRGRRIISWGANSFAGIMLGLNIKDSSSGFRALNSKAATILANSKNVSSNYLFEEDSLYLLKSNGMKLSEIPFIFQARQNGKSKMGAAVMFKFFFGILEIGIRRLF